MELIIQCLIQADSINELQDSLKKITTKYPPSKYTYEAKGVESFYANSRLEDYIEEPKYNIEVTIKENIENDR